MIVTMLNATTVRKIFVLSVVLEEILSWSIQLVTTGHHAAILIRSNIMGISMRQSVRSV
jgi:hypothetical protein